MGSRLADVWTQVSDKSISVKAIVLFMFRIDYRMLDLAAYIGLIQDILFTLNMLLKIFSCLLSINKVYFNLSIIKVIDDLLKFYRFLI